MISERNPFGLGGFTEAGIGTRNPNAWVELLCGLGGWREIWRGETPQPIRELWSLDPSVRVTELLLTSERSKLGRVRLFHTEGLQQKRIRPDTNTWDCGGIFDLDIRVPSLPPFVQPLQQLGWQGLSPLPVDWQFGPLQVREWLTRGLDDVVLALIERIAPPLEGWDDLKGFSEVFNSSQIVADMDRSVAFYETLGMVKTVEHIGPLQGRGGEVLGLKPEQAPKTPVRLVILAPPGRQGGSLELVSFEDADVGGQDLSALAAPFNLGLNLLRFPVRNLHQFMVHLENAGITPEGGGIIQAPFLPQSETTLAAIRSPDGVWLEFYQAFEPPITSQAPYTGN